MKSPFPGMDPYLEAYWGDVHISLIAYARDAIKPQLPGDLSVKAMEHVSVAEGNGSSHGFYPDVKVVERPGGVATSAVKSSRAVAEPLIVSRAVEPGVHRWVQIFDRRSGGRVVTSLEVLSPANKTISGSEDFMRKQEELLSGGVNLVEIDLMRSGKYALSVPEESVPLEYLLPYRICAVRASNPHDGEMYRVSLREPLPTIRVPLRPQDADIYLDIQSLVNQTYENSGYDHDLNYGVDPIPQLSPEDAAWADGLLRTAGKR